MTKAVEAVLSIEVVCDKCRRKRGLKHDLFLEMAPKVGSKEPFFLCPKCWLDYEGFDGPKSASTIIEVTASRSLGAPQNQHVEQETQ